VEYPALFEGGVAQVIKKVIVPAVLVTEFSRQLERSVVNKLVIVLVGLPDESTISTGAVVPV
jgi:hypothetical protein